MWSIYSLQFIFAVVKAVSDEADQSTEHAHWRCQGHVALDNGPASASS